MRVKDSETAAKSRLIRASPHPSPGQVMIVQVMGFAGLSVKEGILAVFLTEAKALRSRAVVRGRVPW